MGFGKGGDGGEKACGEEKRCDGGEEGVGGNGHGDGGSLP